jgi:methyl-accepting chemotaxis protein
MAGKIPWTQSFNLKLGGISVLLSALLIGLIVANVLSLTKLEADSAKMNYFAIGRAHIVSLQFLTEKLSDSKRASTAETKSRIRKIMNLMAERFDVILNGSVAKGIPAVTDPKIVGRVKEIQKLWNNEIKPSLESLMAVPSQDRIDELVESIKEDLKNFADITVQNIQQKEDSLRENVETSESLQYAFLLIAITFSGIILWIVFSATSRLKALVGSSEKIRRGDLEHTVPVRGNDEIAVLAESFNSMTESLRAKIVTERAGRERIEQLMEAIKDGANSLASASSEVLAGTTQQASGAQEQASAVAQTVSTVDEVRQTSEQAAERAKKVADSSQRAAEIGEMGRKSIEESVAAMGRVQEQTEAVAESILALAEQAQAIGEIIATVNDIAEQTNLLALNAGIEASRAGEHGSGFTVVAREIKELAGQAKKATAQVRQILGEIQKATNSAVMTAEEGTKSVNATLHSVNQAGNTINSLAEVIKEAAQAATQISASAGQQATGMAQIQQAMKDIDQTTRQNLASAQQSERAAQDLSDLGTRLKNLLAA